VGPFPFSPQYEPTKSEQSSIDPLTRNDTVASGVKWPTGLKTSEEVNSHVPQSGITQTREAVPFAGQ
jgi:hypothetical protein